MLFIIPLGQKEETCDKLKSILSQLEYSYQVCLWDQKGVPFKKHFYVPEAHPLTQLELHERENDTRSQGTCILCMMYSHMVHEFLILSLYLHLHGFIHSS